MISGIRVVFALCLLCWAAGASATDWGLPELGRALGNATEGRVPFREERTVAFLSAPVVSTGYVARHGERIEKHVVAPKRESVILDGSHMEVESEQGWQSYDIDDHPMLRGLAVALQAGLTGRFAPAEEVFEIALTGDRMDWSVVLTPKPGPTAEVIDEIALQGMDDRIKTIDIRSVEGDRSTMTLLHGIEE